jgi:hypothetical protein
MRKILLPFSVVALSAIGVVAVLSFFGSLADSANAQAPKTQGAREVRFSQIASTPNGTLVLRAETPSGWLVLTERTDNKGAGGITFVPDEAHDWNVR